MKLTFANGSELDVLGVHGRTVIYEGIQRDSLIFLMDPNAVSLEDAMGAFTESACKTMQLTDDKGNMFVHEHYTIRVEVGQGYKDYALTGGVSGQDMEQMTYVRMARSTLAERQLQAQQEAIDALVLSALEG